MTDAIPAPIQNLVTLFGDDLREVRFPDMDAEVLSAAAADVDDLAAAVTRAESALEAARAALEGGQEALLQKAQRALAYARIFAEEDPRLGARLEAIALPRVTRRASRPETTPETAETAAPRRGRPKKDLPPASLFAVPQSESVASAG